MCAMDECASHTTARLGCNLMGYWSWILEMGTKKQFRSKSIMLSMQQNKDARVNMIVKNAESMM